jgi:tetratricopeptide (TPR) repeat protein
MARHLSSRFGQLWLLLLIVLVGGCRLFRSRQPSEDDLAQARQLSRQGLDAQQRSEWQRAELLFAAAIVKSPADERARWGYAESLWRRGDTEGAIASMEEAVRLSGYDPERRVRLGTMYLARGDMRLARLQAERAITTNPQLAGAWALLGKTQNAAGLTEDALASFHRALSLEPDSTDVQLAVADVYASQSRPHRALATLQTLADRFPAAQVPVDVLYREALALRALGEIDSAKATVSEALGREPRHSGCLALIQELGGSASGVVTAAAVRPAVAAPP